MNANLILFFFLAIIAIASAGLMVFTRNAIYCALYLILNFITVAIFYLLLDAPFIAISQVTVYAGAIMVLFLFVIMLLGAEATGIIMRRWWWQPVALGLGAILLIEIAFIVLSTAPLTQGGALPVQNLSTAFGSPAMIGEELFVKYLLPFEATSILLLIAMIGAIVMTKSEKKLD
jgi:NADH-quinone oxidoreductase subunit J